MDEINTIVYKCTFLGCEKVFATKDKRTFHLRNHELPFACLHCLKRFPTNKDAQRHESSCKSNKNMSKSVYQCKCCVYRTSRLDNLKRHCNSTHKELVWRPSDYTPETVVVTEEVATTSSTNTS